MKKKPLLIGILVIASLWLAVWGVTEWAANRKASAVRVAEMIEEANFEDWSGEMDGVEASGTRRKRLEDIATVFNRLDLRERERLQDSRSGFNLFKRLTPSERIYFLELTLTQSMQRMMEAFDKMDPKERQRLVEKSLRDMEGQGGEDLARLKEEDPEIIDRIVKEGLASYYQNASADTKMDLAPLMDAFGEMLNGFARPSVNSL
ncbi:hypothetical protein N9Z15_03680 [Akkermansiaceae bacterium]|nr:hypothetical protein [Akkermansiaceae bacterium]